MLIRRRRWLALLCAAALFWIIGGEWVSIHAGVPENHFIDALGGLSFAVAGVIVTGMLVQVMAMCDVSQALPMRVVWMASVATAVAAVIGSVRGGTRAGGWRPSWPGPPCP